MRKLKLFFACMLMAVLSVGQVWAASPDNYLFSSFTSAQTVNLTTTDGFGITLAKNNGSSNPAWSNSQARVYAKGSLTISIPAESNYKITAITYTYVLNMGGKNNVSPTIDGVSGTGDAGSWNSSTNTWTASGTGATSVAFTTSGTAGNVGFTAVSITYTTSGGGSDPSLSASPATIDFGTVYKDASVENKAVAVTFANLTGSVSYSGLTSPFTASGTVSTTGDEITIAANTATIGNYSQTLTVQSSADSKSQDVTVKMNVVEPFDGLKLTFGVSSNPGEWPTTNSTTTTNYTYTLNEVDYTFALNNVKCNSGYLMLTSVAKLGLPAISGYKLVKVEATNSSGCSTNTKVKITEDEAGSTVVTGGADQTWSTTSTKYTYTLSGTEAETMYYLYVSNKNCQLVTLELYYEEVEASLLPKAAKPTFATGDELFLTSTSVTLACETEGASIYYTTNGDEPTSSSTLYNGAINVTATTTIKAIAVANGYDNSNVAEKTFTKATIHTPAQALAIINEWSTNTTSTEDYYVQGTISQIDVVNVNSFATYYISADGTTTDQLQVYKGLWVNGDNFTSADQIQLGDDVLIKGKLKKYNSYKEFDQNNEVVSYKLKARLSWSAESFDASLEGTNTFPTLTNTNDVTVTYSSSDPAKASFADASVYEITLKAEGLTTITASFEGNETYKANSASYILNVASSLVTLTYNVDGGEAIDPVNALVSR